MTHIPIPYARETFDVINVVHAIEKSNGMAIEVCQSILQRMLARPADRSKRVDEPRTAPQPDHPISTVVRRPENRVVFAEGRKRARYVIRPQSRTVGPDDYNWAWTKPFDHACHALSQIAIALRPNSDLPRPRSRAIGRDGEPRRPPWIMAQPLQQRRKHHALETPGRSPPGSRGEAALADAEARVARENNEVTG
jgi:hypothetical protein